MSNSLLEGTTWYWRQGIRQAPILGDSAKTRELYTPVKNEEQANALVNELKQKGITVDYKRTHSSYDVVPSGSLIVFAASSLTFELKSEKENMEKLKSYILANGGKMNEQPRKYSVIRTFMQNLFGRK